MQNMPDTYNVVVNSNHKLISKILKSKGPKKKIFSSTFNRLSFNFSELAKRKGSYKLYK